MSGAVASVASEQLQLVDPRIFGALTEAKAREWGLPFAYDANATVADIRQVETAQVRASEHRVDQPSVDQFAEQMRNGAVFPPIVLMNDTILVDGNTRLNAARQIRRKTFPVYRIQFPNGEIAKAFAAALNQQNGRRLTTEEAHSAAMALLQQGHEEDSVAREIGYSKTQVMNWRKEAQFRARTERARLWPRVEMVPKALQRKLATIAHDAPFQEAAILVAGTKPKAALVTELVDRVNGAVSDGDALAIVADVKREWAPAGPQPQRVTLTDEMRTARLTVPRLSKLLGRELLLVETNEDRRAAWLDQWRDVERLAVIELHG
jgi:transposase-like protein